MAICDDCRQEMNTASSCTHDLVLLVVGSFPRPRHRSPRRGERCRDCGVLDGGVHHFGCVIERCPCCDQQQLECGCGWDHVTLENEFGEWSARAVPSGAAVAGVAAAS